MDADRPTASPIATGVWRVSNRKFRSNTFISALSTTECFVVDPGTDPDLLLQTLDELALVPRFVALTHGHFDHAGGASVLQERFGTPVLMDLADRKTVKASNFLLMAFKVPFTMSMPNLDSIELLDEISEGRVTSIAAPGHTPGSVVIRHGSNCFTGDTLYADGIGLSKLPGEDHDVLRASLRRLWDALEPTWTVHPGHGASMAFGDIRTSNAALLDFLALDDHPLKR